jgi:hypothetical protein
MSIVESLLTTPDGLALVGTILGALGLGKVRDKAAGKIRRLADAAERLLARLRSDTAAAAAIAKDPDRALEAAIELAADRLDLEVNAKELRRTVAELVLRGVLEDAQPELDEIVRRMERLKAEMAKPGWNKPFKGEVPVQRGTRP